MLCEYSPKEGEWTEWSACPQGAMIPEDPTDCMLTRECRDPDDPTNTASNVVCSEGTAEMSCAETCPVWAEWSTDCPMPNVDPDDCMLTRACLLNKDSTEEANKRELCYGGTDDATSSKSCDGQ